MLLECRGKGGGGELTLHRHIDCGDMPALERKIIIKCRGKREEIPFNVEHVGPIQTKKRSWPYEVTSG